MFRACHYSFSTSTVSLILSSSSSRTYHFSMCTYMYYNFFLFPFRRLAFIVPLLSSPLLSIPSPPRHRLGRPSVRSRGTRLSAVRRGRCERNDETGGTRPEHSGISAGDDHRLRISGCCRRRPRPRRSWLASTPRRPRRASVAIGRVGRRPYPPLGLRVGALPLPPPLSRAPFSARSTIFLKSVRRRLFAGRVAGSRIRRCGRVAPMRRDRSDPSWTERRSLGSTRAECLENASTSTSARRKSVDDDGAPVAPRT